MESDYMRLHLNIYRLRCLECHGIFYEAAESLLICPYCNSGLMIQELDKIKEVILDVRTGEVEVIEKEVDEKSSCTPGL